MLAARGIAVGPRDEVVLADVSLDITPGQVLSIVGPNGAGKSTLLRVLAGIVAPDAGEVLWAGAPLSSLTARERARRVAYLPQHPAVHWPLTVERLVGLGRTPHLPGGWLGASGLAEADEMAVALALQRAEVTHLRARAVNTLSGGERMRVLVARLLVTEAQVMLIDEPVAALDPYFQLEFMAMIGESAAAGTALVLVLHDLVLASRFCDRALVLDAGSVRADGPPAEVLTPEVLAKVFAISAQRASHRGENYLLPWQRLKEN